MSRSRSILSLIERTSVDFQAIAVGFYVVIELQALYLVESLCRRFAGFLHELYKKNMFV